MGSPAFLGFSIYAAMTIVLLNCCQRKIIEKLGKMY